MGSFTAPNEGGRVGGERILSDLRLDEARLRQEEEPPPTSCCRGSLPPWLRYKAWTLRWLPLVPDPGLGSVFPIKHHAAVSRSAGAGLRSRLYRRYPRGTLCAPSPAPLASALRLRVVRARSREGAADLAVRERVRLHASAGRPRV